MLTCWSLTLLKLAQLNRGVRLGKSPIDTICLVEAQVLWDDPNRLEIPAKTQDEARSVVIGQIQKKHWSAFITYRGDKVRIISVRRSRRKEIIWYES